MESDVKKSVLDIVPGQSDSALAAQGRAELAPLLHQVFEVLNRYHDRGLLMNWQMTNDQFGKRRLGHIEVIKPL